MIDEALAVKLKSILGCLDERQRRLVLAAEANALGRGGVARVAEAAGVARATIAKGQRELREGQQLEGGRVRRPGGGRKRSRSKQPKLVPALMALVDPETRGDPESPLLWTSKSTRSLAEELQKDGFDVSHNLVSELLKELGFNLQAVRKTREGGNNPDRDAQFNYLNARVQEHLMAGMPVVSVDCKKKELVGDFKNAGREWQPKGQPEEVRVHDFVDPVLGKAIPYGIYDVGQNLGWVSVGVDHETSAFAVETLRRWWQTMGQSTYPQANRLLICADGGGSNGSRVRLWKAELAKLAAETGLEIAVSHLPPGTSKWNKIEHRLFAYITMNWRGRPLVSHEVIVQLIAATKTREGLKIHAELDPGSYPTSIKVSDAEFATLPIIRDKFHGEWNYTILPTASKDQVVS